jgi:adenylate cyclase
MGVEIERKFLVTASTWRLSARSGLRFSQGYVYRGDAQVRVRVAGSRGFLTVKGPRQGISRSEYEYEIPLLDAEEMLRDLCRPPILEKVRYEVRHGQHLWEVDVYDGGDTGLVLAEIELSRPDEAFDLPEWVGPEVTGNPDFGHERFTRGRSFAALGSRMRGVR